MDPRQDAQDFVVIGDNDLTGYDEELLPQSPQVIGSITEWLQPTDYLGEGGEYKKHLGSYVAGTDLWIQETDAYQKWHDSSDHGTLWTKAIAGAGKSVFAAMIASQLARVEKVPVLFFFFRQIIATNHDPHSMARDWIAMVLEHSPLLQARMKKHMDDHRTLENISTNEFWQDLVRALTAMPKVYCVVDALDEMDIDKEDFLKSLVALGQRKPSNIKLMLTSRPLPRIERFFKDPLILQIRLEQLKVDNDISVYLGHRLRDLEDVDESVRTAIKDSICQRSQGSFLYARLMMDEILDHTKQMISKAEFIQRSLDRLPNTLEDMYNGMLQDHSLRSKVPQELQLTILQWVTHSSRPLRLLELATMLDCQSISGRVAKDTKSVVRAACGPLLEILEDETVSVIHHSFTEFLIDTDRKTRPASEGRHPQFPVIVPITTHTTLALICLKYLGSGCVDDWKLSKQRSDDIHNDFDDDFDDYEYCGRYQPSQDMIRMRHPFLEYAMNNFHVHASKLENIEAPLLDALDSFMTIGSRPYSCWLDMNWPDSAWAKVSPMHVASWAGMTAYVRHLLQVGLENNGRDGRDRTPLSWASAKGNTEVAALLIQNVADPDLDDYNGHKPLHYAALANHDKIVRYLLAAGVSPTTGKTRDPGRKCGNSRSRIGDSPLMYCCNAGSFESVREMIPYLKSDDLKKGLCWAARNGRTEVVELILESPATPADLSDYADTPLFLAASGLHFDVMRILLKKGADPNKRSSDINLDGMFSFYSLTDSAQLGPTPLHAVCGNFSGRSQESDEDIAIKCALLLLEAGCAINAIDTERKTPLHHVVSPRHFSTRIDGLAKILLENGADAMALDKDENTPLHLVKLHLKCTATLEALLGKGADITKRNLKGETPVHTMLGSIHSSDIESLLPYVTDWNVQNSNGDTPLHIIFQNSFDPACAVQALLNAGADLGQRNKKGEAPIHVLKGISSYSFGSNSILPDVLKAGADLDMRDGEGRTVLLRLLLNNSTIDAEHKMVKHILELGADINTRDYEGNGVLHLVCKKSRKASLVQLLLDAGADPLCVNHAGNTLLHEMLNNYRESHSGEIVETLKLLLKTGVPATAQNNIGQTPLHFACGSIEPTYFGEEKVAALEFILNSEIGSSINKEDNNGVRPIHLAVTISEPLLVKLIRKGADPTSVTHEGKNLLHIAARTKNTNSIGLLLEHFSATERGNLINGQDFKGRTALHEACRSGRPESVELLLKSGSSVHIKDKVGLTPLHACAEFEEEKLLWSPLASNLSPPRSLHACGILNADPLRPQPISSNHQHGHADWRSISDDQNTIRIREVVQLLINSGAEFTSSWREPNALGLAISKRVSHMADELLLHIIDQESRSSDKSRISMRGDRFSERYVVGLTQSQVLETDIRKDGDNSYLCETLLALGQYKTIELLPEIGVDILSKPKYKDSFLTILTRLGYSSLLETLGSTVLEPGWVNGKGVNSEDTSSHNVIIPYILTAVQRSLPNLDVLKTLVEKFNADINIQLEHQTYNSTAGISFIPGASALHILASGTHWWQTKGLEYLLQRGADMELKDECGRTPLHVAVNSSNSHDSYLTRKVAQILLQHGANPNTTDNTGSTCLNSCMNDIELVRLLVKHGADINFGDRPALFTAITSQDITTIAILLEAGADCNVRQKPMEKPGYGRHRMHESIQQSYAIHYAASAKFNNPQTRDSALRIIKLLLDHGADPFLNFNDNETIIHDIFEQGGILQPFLEIPTLDLECRDPKGRTILLAAAKSKFGALSPTTFPNDLHGIKLEAERARLGVGDPGPVLTVYNKGANLLAVDNEGNNVLHFFSVAEFNNLEQYQKAVSLFVETAPTLIHQKNSGGLTPSQCAMKIHRMWFFETLLNAGADVLEKDPEGNTPLHYLAPKMSSISDAAEWLKRFLALGISINAKNNQGETAVFSYFRTGQYATNASRRKNLVPFEEAGADFFTKNNEGETLLHIVATKTYTTMSDYIPFRRHEQVNTTKEADTFKFLMEKGLDPTMEDNSQKTAIDVAAACGNAAVLALFQRDKINEMPSEPELVDDEEDW